MKNKIIIGLGILVIFLGVAFGLTFSKMRANKQTALRWENNYNEVKKEVSRVELTYKEFKEQATVKEDSLLAELKIKPKQVEKIIKVENKIVVRDTIKVDLTEEKSEEMEFVSIYRFKKEISCMSIEGYSMSVDKPEIYFTNIKTDVQTDYVAYQERTKRKILFFETRLFGKKRTELQVKSSCGDVRVQEIDIIKKRNK